MFAKAWPILAVVLLSVGPLAACGDDDDDGDLDEGELCAASAECDDGMACVETPAVCVQQPCPHWVCLPPCGTGGECSGVRSCELEPRKTIEGSELRICGF